MRASSSVYSLLLAMWQPSSICKWQRRARTYLVMPRSVLNCCLYNVKWLVRVHLSADSLSKWFTAVRICCPGLIPFDFYYSSSSFYLWWWIFFRPASCVCHLTYDHEAIPSNNNCPRLCLIFSLPTLSRSCLLPTLRQRAADMHRSTWQSSLCPAPPPTPTFSEP